MKTIQEMAREAGFDAFDALSLRRLEAFAALVREDAIADEREDCAKVCLDWMEPFSGFNDYCKGGIDGLVKAAKAIRARSNT